MNEYKGDSPGKKMARWEFWRGAWVDLVETGFDDLCYAPVLVLASAEGGDITLLNAAGVPGRDIYAAELDTNAARCCQVLHPDANVFNEDVRNTAMRRAGEWGIVLLDFCTHISAAATQVVLDVTDQMPIGGILGVVVLKGREKLDAVDDLNLGTATKVVDIMKGSNRRTRRIAASLDRSAKMRRWRERAFTGATRDRIASRVAKRGPTLARVDELGLCLNAKAWAHGRALKPLVAIDYVSKTRAESGSPMLLVAFQIIDWDLRQDDHATALGDPRLVKWTMRDAERAIADALESGERPGIFNLTRQQAAARKAHGTMGTYR